MSNQARLFAWMGFDGLFFARADYRDKDQRKENKTLQMVWHGSGKEEDNEGRRNVLSINFIYLNCI